MMNGETALEKTPGHSVTLWLAMTIQAMSNAVPKGRRFDSM
jgi:hypothetical protein